MLRWPLATAMRSRRRRPPRASRPAAENRRNRSRLAPPARAGSCRAGMPIQAVSSQAIATSSHQIWFLAQVRYVRALVVRGDLER
jgi:hypothetical protein